MTSLAVFQAPIDGGVDTTYWCEGFAPPKLTTKHHIVMVSASVVSESVFDLWMHWNVFQQVARRLSV